MLPGDAMPPSTQTKTLKLSDVPVAANVDLKSLKGDDGLDVLAVFQPTSQAETTVLKALLAKAVESKLAGGLGHLTAAEASHVFFTPALHWVGGIELPDGRIAFRGVVDQAQTDLVRWIKAGQVSFEPWAEGQAVSLDAMSKHRATHGVPALVGTDDDDGARGGDGQGNAGAGAKAGDDANSANHGDDTTTGGSGNTTSGEMAGLTLTKTSIVPANQRDGEHIKPVGYDDTIEARTEGSHVNETMQGMPVVRRRL